MVNSLKYWYQIIVNCEIAIDTHLFYNQPPRKEGYGGDRNEYLISCEPHSSKSLSMKTIFLSEI
jgi:hypothetical protein